MIANLPPRETRRRTARTAAGRLRRVAAALTALIAACWPRHPSSRPPRRTTIFDPDPGGAAGTTPDPGPGHHRRGLRRRHRGLAGHLDRGRGRPGRGHRGRTARPGAVRPPGRPGNPT